MQTKDGGETWDTPRSGTQTLKDALNEALRDTLAQLETDRSCRAIVLAGVASDRFGRKRTVLYAGVAAVLVTAADRGGTPLATHAAAAQAQTAAEFVQMFQEGHLSAEFFFVFSARG